MKKVEYSCIIKVMEKEKKRRLPLGVRLLLLPFKIILVIFVLLLLWFAFCRFDRIKPIDALPPDFAVYLRTDKIWDTAEPLLDLNATLVAMTSPELQKYRETYLNLKSSKLRKNAFVKFALKRRFDAAVYVAENSDLESSNNAVTPANQASSHKQGAQTDIASSPKEATPADFVAVLDSGVLAGALRLTPYVLPRLNALQGKIELCNNRHGNYYMLSDAAFFVIKKNLVVFSNSRELMEEAMSFSNRALYNSGELASVNARLREPLRILVKGRKIAAMSKEGVAQNYLSAVSPYLSDEEYTVLNFGITNTELNLNLTIPMEAESLEMSEDSQPHPVIELLKRESKVPSLLPKFTEDVQYYTLFSAGGLRELKEAASKILPPEKNFNGTWSKSDSICRIVFNRSLDDILLSWTGDEFAVFGIEGKSEPVFAIKIADEEKRQEIFERIFSSYIVQSNDSLLIDGVRLPCIQLPGFLLSILQSLDVNVPRPYYLVKDDFIYFSQSPENLVSINSKSSKTKKLSGSENWMRVSSKQSAYSSVSLYYNLERSVPFFIKGNSAMSKILSLYNSGRFDFRIKDNNIMLQLQASALELESARSIPGFPIALENKTDAVLVKSNTKKNKLLFWIEKDSTVNSLDYGNFEKQKKEFSEILYITAADENTTKTTEGVLWAVTKSGLVYLLDSKLESIAPFPVLTGMNPSCAPFIYKESLALCDDEGIITFVSADGKFLSITTETEGGIKSVPAVSGDFFAFYEKGFFGGIHIYKNFAPLTTEGPLELDGIAYGSPCILTNGSKQYVAMITQAGTLYAYDLNGNLLPDFPVTLPGIFYLNVKSAGGYIFALSSDGELWRVSLNGETTQVKIPYFTAKSGNLTVHNYDSDGAEEIFVSGEGNSIYGFNSKLELLPEFPVAGYGNPVFVDLNGDLKKDCLAITFDNTLSAVNVLQ